MKSYRLVYLGGVGGDVPHLAPPNEGFGPTPRTQGTQPWGAVPAQRMVIYIPLCPNGPEAVGPSRAAAALALNDCHELLASCALVF